MREKFYRVKTYKNLMRHQRGFHIIWILILLAPIGIHNVSGAQVVLVTGFEPFGNYTVNPSQLIAEVLNGSTLNDAEIVGVVLPVDFNESVEMTTDAIQHYHPDLVMSLGLNARSQAIRVEKIGINLKRYPKDDGTWSFPRRIDVSGPFLRFSPLHTVDIVRKIRAANISVQQSFFAGTYVCNTLFYQLLGYVTDHNRTIKVGFIHVPLLDSQDPYGMSLQTMINAVKIAIQVGLE
jgi:pyroglutamyl-peptidase